MKSIIEIHSLGKKYSLIKRERYRTLRDAIGNSFKFSTSGARNIEQDFWALQDINITIGQGERAAIIGKNGAGKSTLLKILSGIIPPTTGTATIHGRLASLLEVGTGFHPELTGRENIYFNGSVLGLKKMEINRQFDAIVDFSGVGAFLDVPLKKYSTGMELRLAFAVAAHLEPEVLLIDEVLAVGDLEFQKKCLEKMDEVSRTNGKTILFVSHNLAAVKKLCETAFLLNKGKLINVGPSEEIVNKYVQESFTDTSYIFIAPVDCKKAVFIRSVTCSDKIGNTKNQFDLEEPVVINIEIENKAMYRSFSVGVAINDMTERRILIDSSLINCSAGETAITIQLSLPPNIITPGTFMIDLSIEKQGSEVIDFIKNAIQFELLKSGTKYESLNYDYGVINTAFDWVVQKNTPPA